MPVGFGVSGSTAVVFLGVLIASGTLYTAAAGSAEQVSDAHEAEGEELLDRRNTVIEVSEVVYNNSTTTLNVTVTNNGTTTLSVADTSLLVDNEYVLPNSTAVDTDTATDVWGPDQSLVMTVDANTTPAVDASTTPDRVKVVAGNGVAASNTTVEEVG
jgi:flagellar protein FlaF